jgi:hypothetical protein
MRYGRTGKHAGMRLILVMTLLLSAGCGRELPARVEAPMGLPAEIGVAYGVKPHCPAPMKLGGLWWSFDRPSPDWPPDITIPPFPFSIWADVGEPYAVPGIVTLTSPTKAIFRADVDGSEFRLTASEENPEPGACL